MPRQFHDVLTSPGGWTCSCGDSGTAASDPAVIARDADDHVMAAWELQVAAENVLGQA